MSDPFPHTSLLEPSPISLRLVRHVQGAQAEVVFIHEAGLEGSWSGSAEPGREAVERMLRDFYAAHAPDRVDKVVHLRH